MNYQERDLRANSDAGYEINLDNVIYKNNDYLVQENIHNILTEELKDLEDDSIYFSTHN